MTTPQKIVLYVDGNSKTYGQALKLAEPKLDVKVISVPTYGKAMKELKKMQWGQDRNAEITVVSDVGRWVESDSGIERFGLCGIKLLQHVTLLNDQGRDIAFAFHTVAGDLVDGFTDAPIFGKGTKLSNILARRFVPKRLAPGSAG